MANKNTYKTSIGGQALIEGILMKGPKKTAISIRKQDGEILTTVNDNKTPPKIFTFPIIRGVYGLINSLTEGMKAIDYSASFFEEGLPEEEPSRFEKFLTKTFGEKWEKVLTPIAMVLGILLAILLFMFVPAFLTSFLNPFIESTIAKNLIEGAIRILIFLAYIILISRMKDIQRVFMYHGAEHKCIFCYESGQELTVENVKKFKRFHPRCGTSFLLIAMIVGVIVFAAVSWENVFLRVILKLVMLPLVVGISYEIIKFAGRHDNTLTRIISAPGMGLQHFTTNEPDDSQIEVAIEALKTVLPEAKGEDQW